ncbi:MAG: sulfatase, partial [Planctomycetota bacterium]
LCRCKMPPAALAAGRKEVYDKGRATHEPYLFEGDEGLTHSSFVASEVSRFLRRPHARPFFCIGGFYAPHAPINPPPRFAERFDPAKMPLPVLSEQETMAERLQGVSDDGWRVAHAYYLALVSHIDDCVGQILATLDECGLADDTLVVFTSDHGEYLGDHGRIGKGMPGQDVITRVVLLMRYPGRFPAGKVVEDMVEAVDWTPTMLHYAAVQAPRCVQGRSLAAAIEGTDPEPRDDILIEHFVPHGRRDSTVKTREHTYHATSDGRELLFDRTRDPHEGLDVSDDPAQASALSDLRRRTVLRLHRAAFNDTERDAAY